MSVSVLLDRPVYGMGQVDRLLGLTGGTARRWIDGYVRGGRVYPPIVREEATGEETVTWGEFVEARLLSEYRESGVPMIRLRPTVERLREEFNTRYPLAHVRPYVGAGMELVHRVQAQDTALGRAMQLVVSRNGQLVLSQHAAQFVSVIEFDGEGSGEALRFRPLGKSEPVAIDPLRQFGEPVVRSVPTEVIGEQFRAGDPPEMIADLYDLPLAWVHSALRFELTRLTGSAEAA